ncbi:MAG: radical SAM protein [Candidatus Aenigmatarchaeota archaeon]
MKVLLVQPNYPFYELKFPPLGIGYIASLLRESHPVSLVDLNVEPHGRFEQELETADVVGINCLTRTFRWARELAEEVKSRSSKTLVVAGGPHVTFTPVETLEKNPAIDIVVLSEGERTMQQLLSALESSGDLYTVPGIAYRADGLVRMTARQTLIEDLDTIPFPAYDLMRMESYQRNEMNGEPVTHIITSRGCPYECIFCICAPLYGRKIRYRSAGNVGDEIELLRDRYGFTSYCFQDDTFGTNRDISKQVCTELLDRDLRIKWWTEMRLDRPDREFFQLMREAGCVGLAFGLESGNYEILKRIKKGIDLEAAKVTMALARETGFNTQVSIILGLPGDTMQTVQETISFAAMLGANAYSVNILTPYPGTELFENQKSYGVEVTADRWDGYTRVDSPVMRTNNFSEQELKDLRIYVAELLNKASTRNGKIFNSYLETFVSKR